jgi:hypothetical protein
MIGAKKIITNQTGPYFGTIITTSDNMVRPVSVVKKEMIRVI